MIRLRPQNAITLAKRYSPRSEAPWASSYHNTDSTATMDLFKEEFRNKSSPRRPKRATIPQRYQNMPEIPDSMKITNQKNIPMDTIMKPFIEPFTGQEKPSTTDSLISALDPEDPRFNHETGQLKELSGDREEMLWEEHEGFHLTLVDTGRPTHLKAKGRIFNQSVTVVVGNSRGLGGYATVVGSGDFKQLLHAGYRAAKKRAVSIPLFEGRTPYHDFTQKYVSTTLRFTVKPAGYGLQVPPFLRPVCLLLGIQDICIKIHGSRNRKNVIHCFFKGLQSSIGYKQIARSTGQHMIHAERSYRKGRLVMNY